MEVSVIIVNFKSKDETINLINSAWNVKIFKNFEVIVVDNSPEEGIFFKDLDIKYITEGKNLGYGGGVNLGAINSNSKYIFFLNPDITFLESLDGLIDILKDKVIGVCPLMVPHKNFQLRKLPNLFYFAYDFLGFTYFFPNFFLTKKYFYEPLPHYPFKVEQPAGASLLIDREKFLNLGGFDTDFYPLYYEDVDFCFRLKEAGYEIHCHPLYKIKHKIGLSLKDMKREEFFEIYGRNALKYFKKRGKNLFLYKLILSFGLFLRAIRGKISFKISRDVWKW